MYEYLIGSLSLLFIWIIFYLKRKDLRKQMLWASFVVMLFALMEPLYVPAWWKPPTLFDLANKTGFDIESFIFSFAIGGLIAAIYYHIFRLRSEKIETKKGVRIDALFFALTLFAGFLLFTEIHPSQSSSLSMFLGGIIILIKRRDLLKKVLFTSSFFTVSYLLGFKIFIITFPEFTDKYYSLSNLTGILISGVPFEEFLFSFSVSFLWSGMYEYANWYKIKNKED